MQGTNRGNRQPAKLLATILTLGLILLGALALGPELVFAQEVDVVVETPKAREAKPAEKAAEKPAEKKADAKTETAKAEKAPAEKKDETKKPAANPLKNLFRGIFGGAKPQGRIIPQNPQNQGNVKQPANGDAAARDRVDARAPFDPTMAKLLRRAENHIQAARAGDEEEWGLALDILKYVLDPSRPTKDNRPIEDSLVRGRGGNLTTMRQEANRMLAEFPPARLASYREEFGGLAGKMFEEAKRNGNVEQIVTVATQFFHTPAGREAANWMGMRHFDHGEFGMAARWFRQLLNYEADLTKDHHWQLKAAVTFHQAGDEKSAKELLAKVGAASLHMGETPLSPDEFLAKLQMDIQDRIPVLDDWPMLYGTPSRLGKAQGGDPLLLARWSQPLTNSHKAIESIDELVDDLTDEQAATVPAFSPIMVDGKVIFRTLRGVRVVDAKSGEMLWETRAGISPESLLTGAKLPAAVRAADGVLRREHRFLLFRERGQPQPPHQFAVPQRHVGDDFQRRGPTVRAGRSGRALAVSAGQSLGGSGNQRRLSPPGLLDEQNRRLQPEDGPAPLGNRGHRDGRAFRPPARRAILFRRPGGGSGRTLRHRRAEQRNPAVRAGPRNWSGKMVAACRLFRRQDRTRLRPAVVERPGRFEPRRFGLPDHGGLAGGDRPLKSFGPLGLPLQQTQFRPGAKPL